MKSLTYFVICLLMLNIYMKCFTFSRQNKQAASTEHSKVENKKTTSSSTTDQLVCGKGKNLGTLRAGITCGGGFPTQCKTMLKKEEEITPTPTQKTETLSKKKDKSSSKHVESKWSLKSRSLKYSKENKISSKSSSEDNTQTKVDVLHISKLIDSHTKSSNKGKDSTEKLVKGLVSSQNSSSTSTEKEVEEKSSSKKVDKSKKELPQTGDFCVQAVLFNLSYCCYFKARKDGQAFANTQPDEEELTKFLANIKLAEEKDERRKAMDKFRKISKALQASENKESSS